MSVDWQLPDDGGSPLTGYTVQLSEGTSVDLAPTQTSHTVTGLVAGEYTVSVVAHNPLGDSAPTESAPVTVRALATPAPTDPPTDAPTDDPAASPGTVPGGGDGGGAGADGTGTGGSLPVSGVEVLVLTLFALASGRAGLALVRRRGAVRAG
ncbi:MAG: fibronectin type III domain-containing protein [Cellulomonadaceae bacterium]